MRVAEVQGGTVTIRDPADVTVARRRAVQVRLLLLGVPRFQAVLLAQGSTTEELASEIGLTSVEAAAVDAISVTSVWALLESWTLPYPFPDSPAGVAALPEGVRAVVEDATAVEAAALIESMVA